MPELPEVETIARTLAPQVIGRTIDAVRVLHDKTLQAGESLLPLLAGGTIAKVHRRAKLLLMDVHTPGNTEFFLAFHLKMTGRLFIHGPEAEPHAHTRMVFSLRNVTGGDLSQLFFDDVRTFGYCRILRQEDFATWSFWGKLGPEPLTCSAQEFITRSEGKRGRIKALLLDQAFIAGIGNIYADEALFRAGIAPDRAVDSISAAKRIKLLEFIQEVLCESIDQCGSSIRDYRDAHGNAGAFQNTFRVYGRGGEPCVLCKGALHKSVVAGRGTVHCPHCQK